MNPERREWLYGESAKMFLIAAGLFFLVCQPSGAALNNTTPLWISIDPIGNQNVNEPFIISGTTNIPLEEELIIVISPANQTRSIKGVITSGTAGVVAVNGGERGKNTWLFPVDPVEYSPNTYKIIVSSYQYEVEVVAEFTVQDKTPATPTSAQPADFPFALTVIVLAIPVIFGGRN